MRSIKFRAIAAAMAIALSAVDLRPAIAAQITPNKSTKVTQAASATEFSARKRHRRRSNRQAVRAFGAVAGLIFGLAAAEQRRREREHYYRYYYGYPYGPPSYGYYHGPYW